MSMSLREQLIQAGLVSKKQVQQADQQQRQQKRQQQKHKSPALDAQKHAAQQAQAAKLARDQELNRKRQEKAERKARHAQIRQLVEQNRVPRLESDDCEYFNFIDRGKVRRIGVTAETRERLISDALMIARYQGFYAIVPAEIAARIKERDPNAIVTLVSGTQTTSTADADDPYKDFVVPDDLKW